MTENLNQNQRREDGTIACGYYEGCSGAARYVTITWARN